MRLHFLAPLVAFLVVWPGAPFADDPSEQPWGFSPPSTEGYAIELVSADPAPGTTLLGGAVLDLKITVSYKMSAGAHGTITLVLQDEKNERADPGKDQVTVKVDDPAGVTTLTEKFTVPAHAKELHVFIPIAAHGRDATSSVESITYPIKEAAPNPP